MFDYIGVDIPVFEGLEGHGPSFPFLAGIQTHVRGQPEEPGAEGPYGVVLVETPVQPQEDAREGCWQEGRKGAEVLRGRGVGN